MSATPPERQTTSASAASGADLSATEARGAVRTGRNIWILIISTALAAILLLGYWLIHAPHMATINHPQARDMSSRDISTFNTPAGSARPGLQDAGSTNSQ